MAPPATANNASVSPAERLVRHADFFRSIPAPFVNDTKIGAAEIGLIIENQMHLVISW
jgi:hypothetical protein